MAISAQAPVSQSPWELAAENIAVKIRWFGLVMGYILVNTTATGWPNQLILNAILALGVGYAIVDTFYSFRGQVFLQRYPLLISLMEALFVGLLCYYHGGLESPFRYYYFLSLICCAIRHPTYVTYITCVFHCTSYTVLFLALPEPARDTRTLLLMVVILGWFTWAGGAMAFLLKRVGQHLGNLNEALRENQTELEARIEERTLQLREAQALLLHQEKMAAFGLLAAGIAHEVGNPLTSVSSLVQILQRRNTDEYTQQKLTLVSGQLKRIQGTLRELINFSRPASPEKTHVSIKDIIEESLNIAKYYKRTRGRHIETDIADDLPPVHGKRDLLVQIILNLLFNAIDATGKDGRVLLLARAEENNVHISIEDNGSGMTDEQAGKIFQPYFTTKMDGTGLGLFVTRKLVVEHGGSIDFSTTLGVGTTFSIVLPGVAMPASRLDAPIERLQLPAQTVAKLSAEVASADSFPQRSEPR